MAQRHRDALAIQQGACNPSGIAHAIVDACREAREEGHIAVSGDPAIRLMVHQLAFLCRSWEVDELDYIRLIKECQKGAKQVEDAQGVRP